MNTPRWARLLGWLLAALAVTWAFSLYLRPDFAVDLANQIWGCF